MSLPSLRLGLPYLQPAQAQKHVTHNEALELLDVIVQLCLQGIGIDTPPVAPAEGETWAIGAAPTGAWSGAAGQLASFRNGGWLFVTPRTGWRAHDSVSGALRVYDGANWVSAAGTPVLENLPGLGINATSDSTNRLVVASDATLLNNAGAGHQLKINKAAAGQTASLLFQSGFSGRAEMGLAGDNDFAVKVSDGTSWFTGLSVAGASGKVTVQEMLRLPPRTAPTSGAAGDIYFDSTTAKLRCHDGTTWRDLF